MSSAIGRFTTALLAGSQENTFALAHVNFDFSLFKVDAPPEFQALGSCLTDERRNLAETGAQHITARKLGALFRGKTPQVPNLISAYGKRVSEISKIPVDPKVLPGYGLFNRQAGIDGTIIWAAATSGSGAIEVQLLACMLARFWTAPEAVSIWEEIIETRKQELGASDRDFEFPEMVAIQANVTGEQLAEWDAGARAWLKTADHIKYKQQTQQRLILNNLSVAVNQTSTTYESIMEAWISAMKTVDKLLIGAPQAVHDGATLVGLTSWHLYPDIQIYEGQFKEVQFEDNLIPATGLLTLGLQSGYDTEEEGIRWSLPLAKLRYYGDPVVATKRLDSQSSRDSFRNLIFVALGALSEVWPHEDERYKDMCLYYINLEGAVKAYNEGMTTWISCFADVSKTFLNSQGIQRQSIMRLMDFGRRHCKDFLAASGKKIPLSIQLLGMQNPEVLARNFVTADLCLQYIRKVARRAAGTNGEAGDWIIVCRTPQGYNFFTALLSEGPEKSASGSYHCMLNSTEEHREWFHDVQAKNRGKSQGIVYPMVWNYYFENYPRPARRSTRQGRKPSHEIKLRIFKTIQNLEHEDEFEHRYFSKIQRENLNLTGTATIDFAFAWGDPEFAALYYRQMEASPEMKPLCLPPQEVSKEDIINCLEKREINPIKITREKKAPKWYHALQALAGAYELYQTLDVTVSMNVTSTELGSSRWYSLLRQKTVPWHRIPEISMSSAFACIIFFETGDVDLPASDLKDVMAVSVDDSIFISSILICDPHKIPPEHSVQRTLGNIGRPGVSLLVPPANPRMRKLNFDDWRVVNHAEYDFKVEDSFAETSLHLWLTDYRVPFATSHRGSRSLPAFFQEAVISVHDRSEWIGDLDIIKALRPENKKARRSPGKCTGKRISQMRSATSVDRYFELLDEPEHRAIVRAQGNWLGRLATAVLSVQLGMKIVILPGTARPRCSHEHQCILNELEDDEKIIIY